MKNKVKKIAMNKEAMGFELSMMDIMKKSNTRAWIITFISMIAAIAAITLYLYKPLTKTIPYVIKVDGLGVPTLLTSLESKKVKFDESLDKFFAKEYVINREEYYYNFIEEDYLYVQLMSNRKVSEAYRKIYEGKESRDKVLGAKSEVEIKIMSISLAVSAGIKNATVRIKVITKKHLMQEETEYKIATFSYEYDTTLILNEKDRLQNPLGFRVLTYRIDSEVSK